MTAPASADLEREPDYSWLQDPLARWIVKHVSPAMATLLPISVYAAWKAGEAVMDLVRAHDWVTRITYVVLLGMYGLLGALGYVVLKAERLLTRLNRESRARQEAEERHRLHGQLATLLAGEVTRQQAHPQDVTPQDD